MSATPAKFTADSPVTRLRSGALSLMENIGQSLAAIGPTLTPALNISVVVGLAGVGGWLSYFLGTLGVVIVAASVGVLAARHPEAGSYFVYIGRSLGPFTGALAGWAMISAYLCTAVAVVMSFVIFVGDFLAGFHIVLTPLPKYLMMLTFIGTVTYAAYRDVRLSSRAGLLMEVISLGIIIIITALFVGKRGTVIDPVQLRISSFNLRRRVFCPAVRHLQPGGLRKLRDACEGIREPEAQYPAGRYRLRRVRGHIFHGDGLLHGFRHGR